MARKVGEVAVEPVVLDAVAAIELGDWDVLAVLLHPYLHWTGPDGRSIRGRRNVLAALPGASPGGPPSHYELRDGQIYRWVVRR